MRRKRLWVYGVAILICIGLIIGMSYLSGEKVYAVYPFMGEYFGAVQDWEVEDQQSIWVLTEDNLVRVNVKDEKAEQIIDLSDVEIYAQDGGYSSLRGTAIDVENEKIYILYEKYYRLNSDTKFMQSNMIYCYDKQGKILWQYTLKQPWSKGKENINLSVIEEKIYLSDDKGQVYQIVDGEESLLKLPTTSNSVIGDEGMVEYVDQQSGTLNEYDMAQHQTQIISDKLGIDCVALTRKGLHKPLLLLSREGIWQVQKLFGSVKKICEIERMPYESIGKWKPLAKDSYLVEQGGRLYQLAPQRNKVENKTLYGYDIREGYTETERMTPEWYSFYVGADRNWVIRQRNEHGIVLKDISTNMTKDLNMAPLSIEKQKKYFIVRMSNGSISLLSNEGKFIKNYKGIEHVYVAATDWCIMIGNGKVYRCKVGDEPEFTVYLKTIDHEFMLVDEDLGNMDICTSTGVIQRYTLNGHYLYTLIDLSPIYIGSGSRLQRDNGDLIDIDYDRIYISSKEGKRTYIKNIQMKLAEGYEGIRGSVGSITVKRDSVVQQVIDLFNSQFNVDIIGESTGDPGQPLIVENVDPSGLEECSKQLQGIHTGYLPNILKAYEVDHKITSMPLGIKVPLLAIDEPLLHQYHMSLNEKEYTLEELVVIGEYLANESGGQIYLFAHKELENRIIPYMSAVYVASYGGESEEAKQQEFEKMVGLLKRLQYLECPTYTLDMSKILCVPLLLEECGSLGENYVYRSMPTLGKTCYLFQGIGEIYVKNQNYMTDQFLRFATGKDAQKIVGQRCIPVNSVARYDMQNKMEQENRLKYYNSSEIEAIVHKLDTRWVVDEEVAATTEALKDALGVVSPGDM